MNYWFSFYHHLRVPDISIRWRWWQMFPLINVVRQKRMSYLVSEFTGRRIMESGIEDMPFLFEIATGEIEPVVSFVQLEIAQPSYGHATNLIPCSEYVTPNTNGGDDV